MAVGSTASVAVASLMALLFLNSVRALRRAVAKGSTEQEMTSDECTGNCSIVEWPWTSLARTRSDIANSLRKLATTNLQSMIVVAL